MVPAEAASARELPSPPLSERRPEGAVRGDLDGGWAEMGPLLAELDRVASNSAFVAVLSLAGSIASFRGDPEVATLFDKAMTFVNAG